MKNGHNIDLSLSIEWAKKHLRDDVPPMICAGVPQLEAIEGKRSSTPCTGNPKGLDRLRLAYAGFEAYTQDNQEWSIQPRARSLWIIAIKTLHAEDSEGSNDDWDEVHAAEGSAFAANFSDSLTKTRRQSPCIKESRIDLLTECVGN